MDQAITRAAFAMPGPTPPACAAPRLVGEFQGFVDGIEPSVRWLDRKNMPQVGDRLFAIPAHAAAARAWSILLTSANHGTVGPLGSTFPHAGEHHERVVVVEVPAAAGAPVDQVNLQLVTVADRQVAVERALKAALDWANEEYVCARNLGKGEPGTHAACDAKQAACTAAIRALAAPVAAQAGQVAPTEATRPLSDSNARFAIDAAIMFGREGVNRPPTDDHWLFEYWNIGQQLAQLGATSGWDNVTPIAAAGQVAVPEGRQALVNEALSAARELGDREYAHAHSLGKGGPGVKAKVLAAEERVVKAITALAAPAEAQQAPATDALDAARYRWLCEHGHERMPEAVLQVVDAAHYEGEQIPKNLIDQVIDKERAAQASTAGEREKGGDRG